MRRNIAHATALLLLVLLVAPSARCDDGDWTEGTPNLQLWDQLNTAQVEIMQGFMDFSRRFPDARLFYNAKWRKMQFNTATRPGPQPVPEFLRRVAKGATEVRVRAYVRQAIGEVKHFGKPSPGKVHDHPTALWSIDPKGRWVIWQRDGLTFRVRASFHDKDGRRTQPVAESALAVARVLDRAIDVETQRRGSVVILLDSSDTMAGVPLAKALNTVIKIARTCAHANVMGGSTSVEWALLTFSGEDIQVLHPFTQNAETTGLRCGMVKAGGRSSRDSLAQAVAYALGYLHANARGLKGKVAILSNGLCAAKGKESITRLNKLLTKLRLRKADRSSGAQYDEAFDPPGSNESDRTLGDALTRLEAAATASDTAATIDAIGVDSSAEDSELIRSIATAAGGQYLPGGTEAELSAAVASVATPEPTTPVAAPPGGGGARAGGEKQLPTTRGSVTICRDLVNGEAVEPSDSYLQTDRICALLQYRDVVPGSNSTAVWYRDGVEYARADRVLDGSGKVSYWMRSSAPGGLPAGAYRLDVVMGGQVVASKMFTIGPKPSEEVLDTIIYNDDDAEVIETGKLTAFNGTYYTLSTDFGMPRRVLSKDVVSVFIGGIGEGVPPDAKPGSIVLSDGTIIKGEITGFDGSRFTLRKSNGATVDYTRDQVRVIVPVATTPR